MTSSDPWFSLRSRDLIVSWTIEYKFASSHSRRTASGQQEQACSQEPDVYFLRYKPVQADAAHKAKLERGRDTHTHARTHIPSSCLVARHNPLAPLPPRKACPSCCTRDHRLPSRQACRITQRQALSLLGTLRLAGIQIDHLQASHLLGLLPFVSHLCESTGRVTAATQRAFQT